MNYPRTRNLYSPGDSKPFRLSRSRLENFLRCPKCFYLDRRKGVDQPSGYPFNLNSAVDHLLKKEFDYYRKKKEPHPLMSSHGIEAVPYEHEDLDEWRENFVGVQHHHIPTNFIVTGAVDDVWEDKDGKIMVVDYKATSKDGEVSLDAEWQDGYKRQMEIYQWLLRQKGFDVSDTGYFVYCNGKRDVERFNEKLEFDMKIIPYTGSDDWVSEKLTNAYNCLNGEMPQHNHNCDYCNYRQAAKMVE